MTTTSSYMNGSFANDGFGFVFEVGPLTPVEGYGSSCLGADNTLVHRLAFSWEPFQFSQAWQTPQATNLHKRSHGSFIQNYLLRLHKVGSMASGVDA